MAWPSIRRGQHLVRQRLAHGDVQLEPDQVEPRDQLGDRVLDLEPGVDLEEVEVAGGGEHELDGPGALVADRLARGDRGLAQPLPQPVVDRRSTAPPR